MTGRMVRRALHFHAQLSPYESQVHRFKNSDEQTCHKLRAMPRDTFLVPHLRRVNQGEQPTQEMSGFGSTPQKQSSSDGSVTALSSP